MTEPEHNAFRNLFVGSLLLEIIGPLLIGSWVGGAVSIVWSLMH